MTQQDTTDTANAPALARADDLSAVVIPLLKGVIYQDADAAAWNALLNLQGRVRDYVAMLGLDVFVDEAEGYAYLRSRVQTDDESTSAPPRLVARRPLSFPVSLLLALLRKKLAEFDAGGSGDTRLVLNRDEILEMIRVFMADSSNEARLTDQLNTHLNQIAKLGFLRELKTPAGQKAAFEVRRIVKAFVDAQWLADFDQRLATYQAQLGARAEEAADE